MRNVRRWERVARGLNRTLAQGETTATLELLAFRLQRAISTIRALTQSRLSRFREGTANKLAYYGTDPASIPAEAARRLKGHPAFQGWLDLESQLALLEQSSASVEDRAAALIALWQARPRKRDRLPKVARATAALTAPEGASPAAK